MPRTARPAPALRVLPKSAMTGAGPCLPSGESALSTSLIAGRSFAGLPTASPEEIGLSRAGLDRMTARFQEDIDRRLLPGVQLLVARHGKVGYLENLGARDPASRRR